MKVMIPTGPLSPQPGNNAVLLSHLVPYLWEKHQLQYLFYSGPAASASPASYQTVPVTMFHDDFTLPRHLLHTAAARLLDRNGFSDYYLNQMVVPNDDSPIDVVKLARFYHNIYDTAQTTCVAGAIRTKASERCDMVIAVKPVADWLINGKTHYFR